MFYMFLKPLYFKLFAEVLPCVKLPLPQLVHSCHHLLSPLWKKKARYARRRALWQGFFLNWSSVFAVSTTCDATSDVNRLLHLLLSVYSHLPFLHTHHCNHHRLFILWHNHLQDHHRLLLLHHPLAIRAAWASASARAIACACAYSLIASICLCHQQYMHDHRYMNFTCTHCKYKYRTRIFNQIIFFYFKCQDLLAIVVCFPH